MKINRLGLVFICIAALIASAVLGFYLDQKYHQYQYNKMQEKIKSYGK